MDALRKAEVFTVGRIVSQHHRLEPFVCISCGLHLAFVLEVLRRFGYLLVVRWADGSGYRKGYRRYRESCAAVRTEYSRGDFLWYQRLSIMNT